MPPIKPLATADNTNPASVNPATIPSLFAKPLWDAFIGMTFRSCSSLAFPLRSSRSLRNTFF